MEGQSREIRLVITLYLKDEEEAYALFKALEPEQRSPEIDRRGETRVSYSGRLVMISIGTSDLGSLRALLNAYAYLLETVRKVMANLI